MSKKISPYWIIPCAIVWFILGIIFMNGVERDCPYAHLELVGTMDIAGIDNVDKDTNRNYREAYIFERHQGRFYAIYKLPYGFYCGNQI